MEKSRDRAILIIVVLGSIALPLVFRIDPADLFRLAKTVTMRTEAIFLLFVVGAAFILAPRLPRAQWRDPAFALPVVTLVIFTLLTLTSTNRLLSSAAWSSAAVSMIVFLATVAAARTSDLMLLIAPFIAAALNTALILLEESRIWMPFGEQKSIGHHLQCGALIGNPNEAGCYFAAAALACVAFSAARSRIAGVIAASVMLAGLVASQTLTAAVAFAAGAFCLFALMSWRNALRAAVAAAIVAVLLVVFVSPLRTRVAHVRTWIAQGEYNAVFTERFTSFVAAWSMFEQHPLTGVGPGAFSWNYYDAKIAAEERFPSLRHSWNRGVNFGEVHNDYLQSLSEGGLLGGLTFVALLAFLGATSFRPANTPRQRFARSLALPLAVLWAVLSLAQFPLESTVVRGLLMHLAAICVGWRE